MLQFAALHALLGCSKPTPPEAIVEDSQDSQVEDVDYPELITVTDMALNPEGIEYDKRDQSFLLSSLNAGPIAKVQLDGTATAFTSGEAFPLTTAGLQVDYAHGRLLAAACNGAELLDEDPETKGLSHLRIYDLDSGALQQDVDLSSLLPEAPAYFANDVAVDEAGNAYVSDWFAGVVYKVDLEGKAELLWTNETGVAGGPNGLDVHPDGYLLVSLINDASYSVHALVRIPLEEPSAAEVVPVAGEGFAGFDGMVLTPSGRIVGVTNDGAAPGGNVLLELSGDEGWSAATVERSTSITTSTTVAVTPDEATFVIHQDFSDPMATTWTIERIEL